MIRFDINKLFPLFILNDKNGYAMAKAIEAAISAMDRVVQQGLDCLLDIDLMPVWRLDEIAKEMQLPYDNFASVDVKRVLIRDFMDTRRYLGTFGAIKKYIEDLIGPCTLLDYYDGYSFAVYIDAEDTAANNSLAILIIENVKNLRSYFANLYIFEGGL